MPRTRVSAKPPGMSVENQPAQRVALVAGGTGLTGSALLLDHPRLANRVLPLEQIPAKLAGTKIHDAFCCLGAPEPRRASAAQLRAVDLELTLAFARAAQSLGATRFVVVSAAGASRSAASAFLKVKGD